MAQSLLSLHLLVERQNVIGGYIESQQADISSENQVNQGQISELIKELIQSQAHLQMLSHPKPSLNLPPGVCWSDIAMELGGETADIWFQNKLIAKNVTYQEMGFCDRKRKKPNIRWGYLLKLAELNCLEPLEQDSKGKLKKQVSELRHDLRGFFKIGDDPFHPFEMGGFYTPRFKIKKKPAKTGIKGIGIEVP